ncbi:putative serine/threonine-protein kinase pknL [Enhygromyxa salina]|uniref:non-specific serine/threonine protein kinase n=1 Tax=Enhygromyxa salina TaxID=215803 RepID=A0A0C2CQJ6_9BACT|nr:protein kinase [Enhygromyxa salina]KIG11990.1 putative serine/threonine-protein kinase pknL [Enhygromyxa salina]
MSDAPRDHLQPNTVVAHRYRVVGYLGDRGFGQVYEAHDSAMDARVCVMRLDREFSHPRVRESFFETRSTAQVEDPRVVDFIDYGEDLDGRLFLVTPWVDDAVPLDDVDGALTWPRIKAIIEQTAKALTAAHAKGVLHGALGLSRILLGPDDSVHVVDFGLAPALTRPAGEPVTNVSPLAGNTAYLAPEQVRDETPDARADVYALGVMLWELVSGAPPFVGDPIEVANAHVTTALPELIRRGAPAEIEALLHLALAKHKDERLATAHEFSALLQAMPGQGEVAPRRTLAPAPSTAPVAQGPNVSRTPTARIAPAAKPAASGKGPVYLSSPAAPPPPSTVLAGGARQPTTPLAPAIKPATPPVTPPPKVAAPPPPPPSPTVGRPAPSAQPTAPAPAALASPAPASVTPAPAVTPSASPETTPDGSPAVMPAVDSAAMPAVLPSQATQTPQTVVVPQPAPSPHTLGAPPPPAKKRRFGKLEVAIIAFLCFDLLLFVAWKLLVNNREAHEQQLAHAELDDDAKANASDDAKANAKPAHEPEAREATSPQAAPSPAPASANNSVEDALAAALPPGTTAPGPTRPKAASLSDKDFREAMVDARADIVANCLDSRMRRTLKVSLKVAPDGEVSFARVVGGLSDTQLGRCVVKRVYRVEFPATHEGGAHTYTLRLR